MIKSKLSEFSDYMRKNYPTRGNSIANRRLVYGVGVNDADYVTYEIKDNKENRCPAYSAWRSMLARGYSVKFKNKQPTYRNVSICKEWLIFSNFRKWFIENHIDGYQLDKDLLVKGNKVYSPTVCIYVPSWVNSFVNNCRKSRGNYKIGVHFDRPASKYTAQCSNPKTKKRENLGYFTNELDAHNAWLKRKLEIALELKPEMDIIDLRIYPNVVEIIKNMK